MNYFMPVYLVAFHSRSKRCSNLHEQQNAARFYVKRHREKEIQSFGSLRPAIFYCFLDDLHILSNLCLHLAQCSMQAT